MAPRTRSKVLNENESKARHELAPCTCNLINGAFEPGAARRAIAKQFSIPYRTVCNTIKLAATQPNGHSKKRMGRPKKVDAKFERRSIRYISQNSFATYTQLKADLELDVSISTIRRILRPHGIKGSTGKPLLNHTATS